MRRTETAKEWDCFLRSSRPNDYLLELIDTAFTELRKKHLADDLPVKHVVHVESPSNEGVRRTWFLIGKENELLGFWTLSGEEVAEAAAHAADDRELRKYLDQELFGTWHTEGNREVLAGKIGSHIAGWLVTQHEQSVKSWQIRWLLEGEPRTLVNVLLEDGRQILLEFGLTPVFLNHLLEVPAHERGVEIAGIVDKFMAQYVDTDLRPINGRPNMSALYRRLLS